MSTQVMLILNFAGSTLQSALSHIVDHICFHGKIRKYLPDHLLNKLLPRVVSWPSSCWTQIYPVFANSVDPDQLASSETNWSGSALFVIQYVNIYQQPGSSNLLGWKLGGCGILIYSAGQGLRRVNALSRETHLFSCFCLPSEKVSSLKGKNLLHFGANLSLFIVNPFSGA